MEEAVFTVQKKICEQKNINTTSNNNEKLGSSALNK